MRPDTSLNGPPSVSSDFSRMISSNRCFCCASECALSARACVIGAPAPRAPVLLRSADLAIACIRIGCSIHSRTRAAAKGRRIFINRPFVELHATASGPKQLWARDLGDGYSSILVSGNVLYTMYRKGSQDVVIALDPASGKTIWETGIDAPHASGMNVEVMRLRRWLRGRCTVALARAARRNLRLVGKRLPESFRRGALRRHGFEARRPCALGLARSQPGALLGFDQGAFDTFQRVLPFERIEFSRDRRNWQPVLADEPVGSPGGIAAPED